MSSSYLEFIFEWMCSCLEVPNSHIFYIFEFMKENKNHLKMVQVQCIDFECCLWSWMMPFSTDQSIWADFSLYSRSRLGYSLENRVPGSTRCRWMEIRQPSSMTLMDQLVSILERFWLKKTTGCSVTLTALMCLIGRLQSAVAIMHRLVSPQLLSSDIIKVSSPQKRVDSQCRAWLFACSQQNSIVFTLFCHYWGLRCIA